jgi:hypothetical protein
MARTTSGGAVRKPARARNEKMPAQMTVAQLRKVLKRRGEDTSGLKKELVARLAASLSADVPAQKAPEQAEEPMADAEAEAEAEAVAAEQDERVVAEATERPAEAAAEGGAQVPGAQGAPESQPEELEEEPQMPSQLPQTQMTWHGEEEEKAVEPAPAEAAVQSATPLGGEPAAAEAPLRASYQEPGVRPAPPPSAPQEHPGGSQAQTQPGAAPGSMGMTVAVEEGRGLPEVFDPFAHPARDTQPEAQIEVRAALFRS